MVEKVCVLLGAGRAAQDIGNTIRSTHADVDIACWRSVAASHSNNVTVEWTTTIKNIDDFSDRFLRNGIRRICLIGRVPDADIRNPTDKESLRALMSDGATLPKILRRLEKKANQAGLTFCNLSSEFAEFSVRDFAARHTTQAERALLDRVRQTADTASGVYIPDSAVVTSDGGFLIEEEGGMDSLLDHVAASLSSNSHPATLVRSCPTGLSALLPSVIGPQTIEKAAAAGVTKILLDADCTVLVERDRLKAALNRFDVELVARS